VEKEKKKGVFDLEGALGFYGSYHNNKINQLIHVIFVPCIVGSAFVIFNYPNLNFFAPKDGSFLSSFFNINPAELPFPLGLLANNLYLSPALLLAVVVSLYYLSLSFVPAITYLTIVLWPLLIFAGYFYRTTPGAWQYALAVNVFSWYMQIHPGHAVFEQRNAALVDNFFAGLALGPLFAWFEVLFTVGWNKPLRIRLQQLIDQNIAEWKAKGKKVD